MTLSLVLQFEELPPLTTSTLGALIPKVGKADVSPGLQPYPPSNCPRNWIRRETLTTRVGRSDTLLRSIVMKVWYPNFYGQG